MGGGTDLEDLDAGTPFALDEAAAAAAADGRKPIGVGVFGENIYEEDEVVEQEQEVPAPVARAGLSDSDINGTEWKMGVIWGGKDKIDVTWVRCKDKGYLQWGWGAEGNWKLEDGTYITFTRDFFAGWHGKRLFSGRVSEDGNFVQGVIRGWKPWDTASVLGKWQAIRLNVDRPNVAPWMDEVKIAAAEAAYAKVQEAAAAAAELAEIEAEAAAASAARDAEEAEKDAPR